VHVHVATRQLLLIFNVRSFCVPGRVGDAFQTIQDDRKRTHPRWGRVKQCPRKSTPAP